MAKDLNLEIEGKQISLEDAFEVFEDIFEDADRAFDHLEMAFQHADPNIKEKVKELKRTITKGNSDKYEYVPDEDEDGYDEYIYQENRRYERRSNIHKLIIIFSVITLLIFGGLFYMAMTLESKPEFGAPTTNEPTKTYEELEKL